MRHLTVDGDALILVSSTAPPHDWPQAERASAPLQPYEPHMDDKQLAKLIRKNVAKVEKAAKAKVTRKYDPTLAATRGTTDEDGDQEVEREQFFKEMKRREF